jgi:hypothetical protein
VITTSVELHVADRTLLKIAAEKLGMTLVGTNTLCTKSGTQIVIQKDKAVCRQEDVELVNKLRVGYAKEVVKHAAKKLGWKVTMKKEGSYTLKKGY